METTIEQFHYEIEKPKRPQLLTVLCVLSFIMCGFTIISTVMNIAQNSPESHQRSVEQIRTINPAMADQMEDTFAMMESNIYLKLSPYINLIFMLGSFLGVMMMWKLNKTGFYIYAVAEILPYISYLFVDASKMSIPGVSAGMGATIMMVSLVFMILCDLVFVFLYSRNLKIMQ
jgi:hypothetical protein